MLRQHIEAICTASLKAKHKSNSLFLVSGEKSSDRNSYFIFSTLVVDTNNTKIKTIYLIKSRLFLFELINTLAFLIQVKRKTKEGLQRHHPRLLQNLLATTSFCPVSTSSVQGSNQFFKITTFR